MLYLTILFLLSVSVVMSALYGIKYLTVDHIKTFVKVLLWFLVSTVIVVALGVLVVSLF